MPSVEIKYIEQMRKICNNAIDSKSMPYETVIAVTIKNCPISIGIVQKYLDALIKGKLVEEKEGKLQWVQ